MPGRLALAPPTSAASVRTQTASETGATVEGVEQVGGASIRLIDNSIIINGNEGVEPVHVGGAKMKRYCHIPIVRISSETSMFGSLKRVELYCLIIMIIIVLKPERSYILYVCCIPPFLVMMYARVMSIEWSILYKQHLLSSRSSLTRGIS